MHFHLTYTLDCLRVVGGWMWLGVVWGGGVGVVGGASGASALGRIIDNKMTTIELNFSELIWKASHPDMQKIRIIGFLFENRLQWQFGVRLLRFTVCTGV